MSDGLNELILLKKEAVERLIKIEELKDKNQKLRMINLRLIEKKLKTKKED